MRTEPPHAAEPKLEAERGDVMALVDGLNALCLTTATAAQVQHVTEELCLAGRLPSPEAPELGG